jgi:FADH2 O2-dependent halogenase
VLRFGNGVTSAGIAVTESLAYELRLADGEPAWRRFLARHPSIAAQFADSKPIREFTWMPRVSYRAAQAAGDGWAMLPSAAAFIDPLFSTGIPLTLLGIERVADALRRGGSLDPPSPDPPSQDPPSEGASKDAPLRDAPLRDADHTACFIAGCYAAFPRFDVFTSYSMFYFAAASFSEMQRRLVPERAAGGFLRAADAGYASSLRELSPAVCSPGGDYFDRIAQAVAPINVAGLCNPVLHNWYPVDLDDTIRAAHKLELTPEHVRAALEFANVESTTHVSRNRRDQPLVARSSTPVSGPP